jgi:hypothetical protein
MQVIKLCIEISKELLYVHHILAPSKKVLGADATHQVVE